MEGLAAESIHHETDGLYRLTTPRRSFFFRVPSDSQIPLPSHALAWIFSKMLG